MKRTAIAATILGVGALLLIDSTLPAHAATTTPVPRCIATTWASQHYHAPKTPRHTTCWVGGVSGPAAGSIGYGGATVVGFDPTWYPSTWATLGYLTNTAGDVTGLLVRTS